MDGILDQTSNQPPVYFAIATDARRHSGLVSIRWKDFFGFFRCNFDSMQELD